MKILKISMACEFVMALLKIRRIDIVKSRLLASFTSAIFSFLMLALLASSARAEVNATGYVICHTPKMTGTFCVQVWSGGQPGNPSSTWSVKTTAITVWQNMPDWVKAESLKVQLIRDHPGSDWHIERNGNKVTIKNDNQHVECRILTDSSGEKAEAGSIIFTMVKYTTTLALHGYSTSGSVMFGENGVSKTVTTDGKTIPQIYAAFQSSFGEGSITPCGFQLPERQTASRSFTFEVTDPGLIIDVSQMEPPYCIPTMTEWGLIILALLIISTAVWVLMRRRARLSV